MVERWGLSMPGEISLGCSDPDLPVRATMILLGWRCELSMKRLGLMLAAAAVISIADGTAHAKMAVQTFPVQAGAGAHDVYPAPDGTVVEVGIASLLG
jgi:hypothetical protein